MKHENTFTISDLLACLETGGKLIGTEKGNAVALSKNEVDCIRLLEEGGSKNSVVVNDSSIVKIEFMINSTVDVKKVDKVVKYNKQKRDIDLYINSDNMDIENLAVKYIMLIKLLCAISYMSYKINVIRFNNVKEIKDDELTFKLVIGSNNKEVTNKLTNIIPLDETNQDITTTVAVLYKYLRLNKLVDQNIVSFVFEEYTSGKLYCEAFKLWIEAYNQFYGFGPEKEFLFLPESIARDENTDIIISYLHARYGQEKARKKGGTLPLDLEFTFKDIGNIVGSAKFITDRCFDKIKQKYVLSMAEKSNDVKVILNYNDLIHPEEVRKNIETGYCLISMTKGKSTIEVGIVVYVANHTMMRIIGNSNYIKTLMEKHKINSYTAEYTEI